ncbi:MAG: DUF4956 domain-containing protein [Clostridiales bacterium]|jgi:uncharacterized membrane protein YhiD involved in acid resistance|nr:DUF4956 domain-containing protein [Clostridiales bacterium]
MLSASTMQIGPLLLLMSASLGLGLLTALVYMYKSTYSGSFISTLVLLPLAVQVVILLVNGNLGIGVAVAGAFSLVRFRSLPGTAREITSLFAVMVIGLATGTGYLGVAVLFALVMAAANFALTSLRFGAPKDTRELKITLPENLDYDGLFDDLLSRYAKQSRLVRVRTTNMGSLYELTYSVEPLSDADNRQLIDQIRTRNGNLNISLGRSLKAPEEL